MQILQYPHYNSECRAFSLCIQKMRAFHRTNEIQIPRASSIKQMIYGAIHIAFGPDNTNSLNLHNILYFYLKIFLIQSQSTETIHWGFKQVRTSFCIVSIDTGGLLTCEVMVLVCVRMGEGLELLQE